MSKTDHNVQYNGFIYKLHQLKTIIFAWHKLHANVPEAKNIVFALKVVSLWCSYVACLLSTNDEQNNVPIIHLYILITKISVQYGKFVVVPSG